MLHSKLPESLLPLPPPSLLVLATGSPARLAMPLESDLQDGEITQELSDDKSHKTGRSGAAATNLYPRNLVILL
jgi:hypothetical protein